MMLHAVLTLVFNEAAVNGQGKLEVVLKGCKNLNDEDPLAGESDPRATLVLKGSEQEKKSTEVEGKNDPYWNETFYFDVLDETEVEVTLVDVDTSHDDDLGVFTIPFRKDHGTKKYDVTLGGSCEVETLFQEIEILKLTVELIGCTNLKNEDSNNKSDPKAKLLLKGSNQEFYSKEQENTIEPFFHEEFSFDVRDETEVEVILVDVDYNTPDDDLGYFNIPFRRDHGTKEYEFNGSSCTVKTLFQGTETLDEKSLKPKQRSAAKDCPETILLGNTSFHVDHMGQGKGQARCPGSEMVDMDEKPYEGKIFVMCQEDTVTGFKYEGYEKEDWISTKTDPKVRCSKKKSKQSEVASKEQPHEEQLRDGPKSLAAPACYSCWRVALLVTLM